MKTVIAISTALLLSATALFALNGCASTETEPEPQVLRPRRLPRATDMIVVGDEPETPSIAF